MIKVRKDLSGSKFGKLLVLHQTDDHVNTRSGKTDAKYSCLCDCGKKVSVLALNLKKGNTTSCGCSKLESIQKHGMYKTKFYTCWHSIIQRCTNPNHKHFNHYGARGITVDPKWVESFQSFMDDMYSSYKEGLEIDRIDVDGNYTKDNCRWVTRQQNNMNRRPIPNTSSEFKGVSWCKSRSKWEVSIKIDYKRKFLGRFECEKEAALAYNIAAQHYYGEYAYLNVIEEI